MLSNIGVPGLIMILVLALLIFGPNKMPQLGRSAGKGIREFKDSMKGLMDDEDENDKK